MALRVWLPLNGNLENKGLSNVIVTNSEATVDNNGKIGQTYSFDANLSFISIDGDEIRNVFKGGSNPFTITVWLYNTKTSGTRAVPFGDYGLTGTMQFNLELNSSAGNWNDDIRFYWGGNPDYRATGTSITPNTWVHLAIVYDGTQLEFYRNGTLVNTRIGELSTKNKTIGVFNLGRDSRTGNTIAFGGKINDFRVYDEALSQKQVKEISKGLVAHYKLEGTGANPNLAIGTNGNTTSINNFTMSLQNGGNTRTVERDDSGIWCTKIVRNNVAYSGWKYMSHNNFDRNAIKTSTTYTVSLDVKSTVSSSMHLIGLLNGNATNSMTNSSSAINGTIIANKWNHLIFTCTTISDFSNITIGNQVIYFSPNDELLGTGVTTWIKNVKLEEGNKATGWIPNETDSLYTSLGYANDICTDVSGNGYTAIKFGTLTFNADSPRYDGSTSFDLARINSPAGAVLATSKDFTINGWFYHTSGTTYYASVETYNTSVCLENGRFFVYPSNGGAYVGTWSATNNVWQMVTLVHDSVVKKLTLFVNGVQTAQVTTDGTIYANNTLNIGGRQNSTEYKGSISDFRIYATALSIDDILTLYKTSSIIDNEGNVYSYEFVEE